MKKENTSVNDKIYIIELEKILREVINIMSGCTNPDIQWTSIINDANKLLNKNK